MADQLSGFIVIMEKDMSEVDAEEVISAIKMIKGIIDVRPVIKEPTENRALKSRLIAEVKKSIMNKLDEI